MLLHAVVRKEERSAIANPTRNMLLTQESVYIALLYDRRKTFANVTTNQIEDKDLMLRLLANPTKFVPCLWESSLFQNFHPGLR